MQALSGRQQAKPSKLFAPGSPRSGYSIFVRALSREAVEGRWLRRFVNLATSDPGLRMQASSCMRYEVYKDLDGKK